MSPQKLRLLADCLDTYGFYPEDDKHRWANDLRGMAKDMERSVAEVEEETLP